MKKSLRFLKLFRDYPYKILDEPYDVSIINMITLKELLKYTVDKKSSDLHISTDVTAYIRQGGDIIHVPNCPVLTKEDIKTMLRQVFTESQLEKFENEMEYDASIEVENIGRFRCSIFYQVHGPGAVFRSILKDIPTFEDIAAPPIFKEFAHKLKGLVLVTGATGTGKSTTLASMINYINHTRASHIITIEDPIEFVYPSQKSLINQRELHRNTLSFQNALSSALRQDPDVILIGELLDLETIRLALTAAETGHLVFATLHTMSAAKTADRIIDVFEGIEKNMIRTMLAESLVGIISQTLLKNTSGGRVAAFEVLTATVAIKNLIRDNKIGQMHSIMQFGREAGMQTLDQALLKLVETGQITKEIALPHATYRPPFE